VTSRASLDLESTASAQAELPSGRERLSATNPSAIVSLLFAPAVCASVSDFFSGNASTAHKVSEAVSSPWFAPGFPLGVHPHRVQPCLAGGFVETMAGASILATPSSFDRLNKQLND